MDYTMTMYQEEVTDMNSFSSFECEIIENHIIQQECRFDFEETALFVIVRSILFNCGYSL